MSIMNYIERKGYKGFRVIGTGGGCEAVELPLDASECYLLLTDCDAGIPEESEPGCVGIYSGDGEYMGMIVNGNRSASECVEIMRNIYSPDVSRVYHCYWGEGYGIEKFGVAITEVKGPEFFSEHHGYKPDQVARILTLRVGESFNCGEEGDGSYSVVRVQ